MKKRTSLKRKSRKNRFAGRAPGEEKNVHKTEGGAGTGRDGVETTEARKTESVAAKIAGTLIWGGLFAAAAFAAWAGLFWLCFAGGACR